jgi:hypothetical protein
LSFDFNSFQFCHNFNSKYLKFYGFKKFKLLKFLNQIIIHD